MIKFKFLFGQKASQVKPTCILAPFLTKGMLNEFDVKNFKKAWPYSSGNSKFFTLIHTQVGAPYVGDAVLYLKDTPCENIVLLGSCGAVQKSQHLNLGTIVAPSESYCMESFSLLLEKKPGSENNKNIQISHVDNYLLNNFRGQMLHNNMLPVKCATFGSLKLEKKYAGYLIRKKIDVVDMECSAFFNAAKYINKKAIAILYVTDILKEKHVFETRSVKDKNIIQSSINKTIHLIRGFTKKLIKSEGGHLDTVT